MYIVLELMCGVCRVCNAVKSEDSRGETEHKELRREYHCAAYNTLVALICCTQSEMKFYTGFLFKEDLIKVDNRTVIACDIKRIPEYCLLW